MTYTYYEGNEWSAAEQSFTPGGRHTNFSGKEVFFGFIKGCIGAFLFMVFWGLIGLIFGGI